MVEPPSLTSNPNCHVILTQLVSNGLVVVAERFIVILLFLRSTPLLNFSLLKLDLFYKQFQRNDYLISLQKHKFNFTDEIYLCKRVDQFISSRLSKESF